MPDLPEPQSAVDHESLVRVLALVRERTGLDFAGYRRPTLRRRVHNRMIVVRAQTIAEYLEMLAKEPGEAARLVERLPLKASRFFRDAPTFAALRPALARRSEERSPARLTAWSAGCGKGEEAYSLAILLDELGHGSPGEPCVLATDVDASALSFASRGQYTASSMVGAPPEIEARYFGALGTGRDRAWRVDPALRGRVELVRHDLTVNASTPDGRRFDLVCCRNVLIYLEPPVQERVQDLLARSVLPGGLLCLGEAEWLMRGAEERFEVVDRRARLFRRRDVPGGTA